MNNKSIITITISLITLFVGCKNHEEVPVAPSTFTINGVISEIANSKVVLYRYLNGTLEPQDSVVCKNDSFSFTGNVPVPEMYYIKVSDNDDLLRIFLENDNFKITGALNALEKTRIEGGKTQTNITVFNNHQEIFNLLKDSLSDLYFDAQQKNDSVTTNRLNLVYDSVETVQNNDISAYIISHPSSFETPYILYTKLAHESYEKLLSLHKSLSADVSSSVYYLLLSNKLSRLEKIQPGKMMTDISLPDTTGTTLALSSLKGKYIVLDFWASWCGPCRRENPNMVKLYNDFNKFGLDILGVSLDDDKESWMNAINDDKLSWHHVSQLKGWQSDVCKTYVVEMIPRTLLIDKEGKIIADGLRGEELYHAVDSLITSENLAIK